MTAGGPIGLEFMIHGGWGDSEDPRDSDEPDPRDGDPHVGHDDGHPVPFLLLTISQGPEDPERRL